MAKPDIVPVPVSLWNAMVKMLAETTLPIPGGQVYALHQQINEVGQAHNRAAQEKREAGLQKLASPED